MLSTRASAAVDRLKRRSGNPDYSMVRGADGLFHLAALADDGELARLSPSLEQDAFVAFVNAYGPQEVKRVSKFDVAFEKQLKRRDDEK